MPKRNTTWRCKKCKKVYPNAWALGKHYERAPTHIMGKNASRTRAKIAARQAKRRQTSRFTKRGAKWVTASPSLPTTKQTGPKALAFCTQCGQRTQPSWRFCGGCGQRTTHRRP